MENSDQRKGETDCDQHRLYYPCIYRPELRIPPASLSGGNAQSAADLNLFLWFYPWKNAGMFYGVISGLLLDLFYSGSFGFYTLIYIYIGYFNGIFTRYYYEDYITLPLILSVANGLWYCMYIYIFRFLIRGRLDLPYYFTKIMLPEIIFTAVTTLLIYRLFLSAAGG